MDEIASKVDKQFLYVLKKIRELNLKTKSSEPIKYWVYTEVIGGHADEPDSGDEILILEKLEEMGAFKILNPGGTSEYE